jgi:hypothetical protein
VKLLECIRAVLPDCTLTVDSVKVKRLPLGRFERLTRVTVRRCLTKVGFHSDEGPAEIGLADMARRLELIETPDGPVRGNGLTCEVKGGDAVVGVCYTEWLTETEAEPAMDQITLEFERSF